MSTAHGIETELKIRLKDATSAKQLLANAGFSTSIPRRFEANTVYDTADRILKNSQVLLRLRRVGTDSLITWKGPYIAGPHKTRPELETSVGSLEMLQQILHALGFDPSFRYEKYRTEYRHPTLPNGTVTLDETPIGVFFELEGASDWIDQTAALLGFEPAAYVLESYVRLYQDDCSAKGVEPSNMVFPAAP